MKSTTLLLAAALGTVMAGAHAGSVIANPDVKMGPGDVRSLYAGDLQSIGGVSLEPVENTAEQAHFLSSFLKTSADSYNNHWTKKAFREGLNPPKVCCSSDAQVISFVKQTPGGVGYIGGSPPNGVKVLLSY